MLHRFAKAPAVLRAASVMAAFAALSACSDDPVLPVREAERSPENLAAARAAPEDRKGPVGLDGVFHELGGRIPGLAGFYIGEDGAVNVMLVDRAQNGLARREVSELLGRTRGRALGHMNVKLVKYDFRRLYAWKEAIEASADDVGLTTSGICEERNRVCIGVRRGGGLGAARALLARLGIPSDAVAVEERDPVIARKLLTERFAPVPGGVLIATEYGCTLGYNAYYQGLRMFVTAAHCTVEFGSTYGTYPAAQPAWDRIIGYEFNDPPTFPCTHNGTTYACRYSDAASYTYVDSVGYRLGRIARPYYTTISVDPANPEFRIIGEKAYPYMGETASFVGRVSGWREGPVEFTCENVTLYPITANGVQVRLLCQDGFKAPSAEGDSGAPVFYRTSSVTDVYLGGILSSGTTDGYSWFSAMQNIEVNDNLGDYYTGP